MLCLAKGWCGTHLCTSSTIDLLVTCVSTEPQVGRLILVYTALVD